MKIIVLVFILLTSCFCTTCQPDQAEADDDHHVKQIEEPDDILKKSLDKLLSQLKKETLMW